QPGSTWDMYGVKAAESVSTGAGQLGSRLANRTGLGFAAGRESRQGPTAEMLRVYYRMLVILTGDISAPVLGPIVTRSQNEIALLNASLAAAGGTTQPRGIFIQGDGFGESEKASGVLDPAHTQFLADKLGVSLRNLSYRGMLGNPANCIDLRTT